MPFELPNDAVLSLHGDQDPWLSIECPGGSILLIDQGGFALVWDLSEKPVVMASTARELASQIRILMVPDREYESMRRIEKLYRDSLSAAVYEQRGFREALQALKPWLHAEKDSVFFEETP